MSWNAESRPASSPNASGRTSRELTLRHSIVGSHFTQSPTAGGRRHGTWFAEDEVVFVWFDATLVDDVRRACLEASVPFDRVVAVEGLFRRRPAAPDAKRLIMKRLFIVGVLVPAVILAASAAGSGSKAWRQLSEPGAASGVGLARTSNGTLHVIWAKGGAAVDARITTTDSTLRRAGIGQGLAVDGCGPAAVVASDGGSRAFLPGSIRAGNAGDDVGIHTATSPQSGRRGLGIPRLSGRAFSQISGTSPLLSAGTEVLCHRNRRWRRAVLSGSRTRAAGDRAPSRALLVGTRGCADAATGAITAAW